MERKFIQALAECAECVWYLKPISAGECKADTDWEEGVWFGIRGRSGEVLVGTDEGVIKVRTVRRRGNENENKNKSNQLKGARLVPYLILPFLNFAQTEFI